MQLRLDPQPEPLLGRPRAPLLPELHPRLTTVPLPLQLPGGHIAEAPPAVADHIALQKR